VIVVDASAVVDALLGTARGRRVAAHLDDALIAPDLLYVEVAWALARLLRAGSVEQREADHAIRGLVRMPVTSMSTSLLASRAWQLRERVRMTDAFYVACALAFGAPLLTTDARLGAAPLPGVTITVVR
jgi:predicted nucleic acid-binding protein